MHSIYIGQLFWPAAAPLIVCMRVLLGGVAIVYDYPHPAIDTYFSTETLNEIFYEYLVNSDFKFLSLSFKQ